LRRLVATLTRVAPEIPVSDMERGIEYYEAKLGFTVEMRMPQGDYAIMERDDVSLHLFEDNSKSQSPVSLHIFTSGLDDLY
jgi:catechol 2,3-dioxygenase-like lactoylglutathione lyase family enzyme